MKWSNKWTPIFYHKFTVFCIFCNFFSKKFGGLKNLRTFAIPNEKYGSNAEIAQLVEHNLAKVGVASSSLVFRSKRVSRNADLNYETPDVVQLYAGRPLLRRLFLFYIISYLCMIKVVTMEVRAKKALGQHFLTDLSIAQRIADALIVPCPGIDTVYNAENPMPALEVGPGMGVLTQYVLQRPEVDLRMVEIDTESVDYLLVHFPQVNGKLIEADFLKLKLERFFSDKFCVIGNFPYNISSQIFFKILDYKEQVPQVVCMIQKEVAERIAEKPGTKTYGILSVLLQAWYDIEYLFTVGEGAFNPPPKVKSAVIRLVRNNRKELGCDEALFKTVVKTGFNQRRKTLRNSLKPLIRAKADRCGWSEEQLAEFVADPVFELRPERLSVEDFIALTLKLA